MNEYCKSIISYADRLEGAALKGISEQDIDHLLVEELQCSPSFLYWFLEQLSHCDNFKLPHFERHRLERSASRSGVAGETDILLLLLSKDGHRIASILIENKISAPFTEGQPERYATAVADERKRGLTSAAVLAAPHQWLTQKEKDTGFFDATVRYEDICEYFRNMANCENHPELQARLRFKAYLLDQAVVRARAVNPVNESEPTRRFREYCFERCRKAYPELVPREMKGEQNIWLNYHAPVGTLRHHTTRHYAGLILHAPFEQIRDQLQPLLDEGMGVQAVGKTKMSTVVFLATPCVNKKGDSVAQSSAIEECLCALQKIWHWSTRVKPQLFEIIKK